MKNQKNKFKVKIAGVFLLAYCLLFGITSCSQDVCESNDAIVENVINIKTLTSDEYNDVINQITEVVGRVTRSSDLQISDTEAQQLLEPLIVNGTQIQGQFLEFRDSLGLTDEEVEILEGLTESQLAELSFTFSSAYNDAATTESVTSEDIYDCLKYALGIDCILEIFAMDEDEIAIGLYINGTKQLMTAKTAKQIIKAIGTRSLGVAWVVWAVYDFADCIKNKKEEKNG